MTLTEIVLAAAVTVQAFMIAAIVLRLRSHGAPRSARDARRRVNLLARRLKQVTERIDAQMSARLDELQYLLAQVEAKADELRKPDGSADAVKPKAPAQQDRRDQPPGLGEGQDGGSAAPPQADDGYANSGGLAIRRLAEQGLTCQDIARQLGRPVGEVILVLRLQRASGEAP